MSINCVSTSEKRTMKAAVNPKVVLAATFLSGTAVLSSVVVSLSPPETPMEQRPSATSFLQIVAYNGSKVVSRSESVDMSAAFNKSFENLDQIAELKDNWNSNGAEAFPPELIEDVRTVITALTYPPMVFPTACYSIQLEYEKENGDYLEIQLHKDGRVSMFMALESGTRVSGEITRSEIDKVVCNFYG